MLSSQSAQVVSDIGLAKTRSALPPSGAACTLGCVFSLALLRLSDGTIPYNDNDGDGSIDGTNMSEDGVYALTFTEN